MNTNERERAISLGQTIARDAVARIEEEFPDPIYRAAALHSVFGFLAGVGDAVLTNDPHGYGLFQASRNLGAVVRATDADLTTKGAD